MLDDSIETSLQGAEVFDSAEMYWTASMADGSGYSANTSCIGFTYNGSDDVQPAALGNASATDGGWLSDGGSLCNQEHPFVCVCW